MGVETNDSPANSGRGILRVLLALAWLAAMLGCPAPMDDDDTTGPPPDDDDTTAGDDAGLLGQVRVLHWHVDSEYGESQPLVWMWGIYDAPFPGEALGVIALESWEVVAQAGDCVYIDRVDPGLCDPPCPGGTLCTTEGACEPLPGLQPAGELILTGLGSDLSLSPDELGYYHLEGTPGLPLFTADATVGLVAAGGATPGFDVSVEGVEDLLSAVPCELELTPGTALDLEWSPASGGATIRWEMFTFMHAGNGPMLRCVTEDDGELTVAAELVDLYLADRTGFATYELSRFRRAEAVLATGDAVGLEVASVRTCFHLPGVPPTSGGRGTRVER